MFEHLLSPVSVGSMELRNRMVMAPMGVEIVGDDGFANDQIIAYYEERARGGVGLIITEVCAMAYPRGANSVHQLGLSDDRYIPALRDSPIRCTATVPRSRCNSCTTARSPESISKRGVLFLCRRFLNGTGRST